MPYHGCVLLRPHGMWTDRKAIFFPKQSQDGLNLCINKSAMQFISLQCSALPSEDILILLVCKDKQFLSNSSIWITFPLHGKAGACITQGFWFLFKSCLGALTSRNSWHFHLLQQALVLQNSLGKRKALCHGKCKPPVHQSCRLSS